MEDKAYTIYNTPEYDEWLDEQPAKSQVQVRSRVSHIQDDGYFGEHKEVGSGVWERKWKNGQDKDIRQAKNIFNKHVSSDEEA